MDCTFLLLGGRKEGQLRLGKKNYEMSNHLGNVLTVITDNINMSPTDGVYATVVSTTDYYPFGLPMAGRTFSNDSYRYGFNGMEKDNEVYGFGNLYTAEFWEYDPRIGRRWNIDPVTIPGLSPYLSFENNPIIKIDPSGNCSTCPKPEGKGTEGEKKVTSTQVTTHAEVGPGATITVDHEWYYHEGSKQGETTYDAGWYTISQYKKILTGSSSGSTHMTPLNVKLALKDFIGIDEQVITESDFTTDQLIALRNIVLKNTAKGKMKIDYEDYQTSKNPLEDISNNNMPLAGTSNSDRMSKRNNPNYILKTVFGQATIIVEDGKTYVVDQYNFNDAHDAQTGKSTLQIFKDWRAGHIRAGGNTYKQFRNLGTFYGSEEGKGSKFKVYIPKF